MLQEKKQSYLIANFGGPRDLTEVRSFLQALLTDRDVIRVPLPAPLHYLLFSWVAKRRTAKVSGDYKTIGGKSPIFDDTEAVAAKMRQSLKGDVITFHRYLEATHADFIEQIKLIDSQEIRVFPMFPQFTYATTGSIAKWFRKNLPDEVVKKLRWVKSYPAHPAFIQAHRNSIRQYLTENKLLDENTILLFSAHGVPQKFVDEGDVYQRECEASFNDVSKAFPKVLCRLSYQSKFGRGEWIKPYTIDVCEEIKSWNQGRANVVFVPISFTSDHIETLFEIEDEYMSVMRENGLNAYRVPGLTLNEDWLKAIQEILQEENLCSNEMLVR